MIVSDLPNVLRVLVDTSMCRGRTGIINGTAHPCKTGAESLVLVTLVCEHEHFYDVALCSEHQERVATDLIRCPSCNVAENHRCRHMVVS